jgi:peptidase M28-like protein
LVKAQALQHPSSYAFLKELSDGVGPRLTGSVEDSRAAEWVLQTMHAIGLQHVHAEPWHLEHGWKRGFACAQLLSPFPLELTVTSYGWAGSTPTGGVEAEVIEVSRTIRIVLFTGEEQGLLGSRAYVQEHQAEADSVLCALVLDWGNGSITKYLFGGHDEFAAPLRHLINSVADVAAVRTGNGYLTYTDAYAFILAGIPGITPFQDSPNYTLIGHSAADTLDKVEADILERDSALLALGSLWIADYPTSIGRHWSPEKTAQMLSEQRTALRALGLWPFSQ